MEFIREGATLPVPLNIIPMPALILKLFRKIFYCVFKKDKQSTNTIEMPKINKNKNSNGKQLNGGPNHLVSLIIR